MFSTLLGPLPAVDGDRHGADAAGRNLADLDAVGLELLSSGLPAADPRQEPGEIVAAWRAAAAGTSLPVKQVIVGPYSAGRDAGPTGPAEMGERLAAAIAALSAAGCPFVEIDESSALEITLVASERSRFVEAHRRLSAAAGVTHLSLALTGGNFDAAGPATFFDLGYASYAFDLIAGPDNWRLIAAAPTDRGVVCGAIDARADGDETRELLVWAGGYAASTAGRGRTRVGLANAPSLASLTREAALRKLRRVAEAVQIASAGSTEEALGLLDSRAVFDSRSRRGRGPATIHEVEPG